ncbi:uncharacterized protein LOC130728165 [Lotus japonicus]|uniref:uncharacterized protein LOC130728165 n=1 Tax=Lotus japonicus TaxID=34305 RepID=UPI002588FF13|nr:uncharacterized protein LOC130728165 [Lotus japonicus]
MGGKGQRRREKNYKAAHGGYSGLPPPPVLSQLDALPSKLRQLISITRHQNGATAASELKKKDDGHAQNVDTSGQLKATQHSENGHEQLIPSSANDKKKKKRKRKEVKDLRFLAEMDKTRSQLKKKERKKKYLESKKKKHKKINEEDELDFPGHEKIKFGDVVQAPPKLAAIPRAFKNTQDAYQERLRLQAIEAYRSRNRWSSRPGSHLPPLAPTSDP